MDKRDTLTSFIVLCIIVFLFRIFERKQSSNCWQSYFWYATSTTLLSLPKEKAKRITCKSLCILIFLSSDYHNTYISLFNRIIQLFYVCFYLLVNPPRVSTIPMNVSGFSQPIAYSVFDIFAPSGQISISSRVYENTTVLTACTKLI